MRAKADVTEVTFESVLVTCNLVHITADDTAKRLSKLY